MSARLLIVEDDENSRIFLSRALSASGYKVDTAANGIEALEQIKEKRPDLIITDIMMPKMDGFEMCRIIKGDEELKSIPVIFYTATYLDDDDYALGISIGAARYLSKPMELPHMLTAIEDVLKQESSDAPVNPEREESKDETEIRSMYERALARKLDEKVETLEHTRNYLRSVFDNMPSLLIGVDSQGKVKELNGAAERACGKLAEEAQGEDIWYLFTYLEVYRANLIRALERREPFHLSRIKYFENGKPGFVDLVLYPLVGTDSDDAVIRIDDITDRIRLEEAVMQTEKMQSVGNLAAGMAHEINNPLGGITLSTQNILRRIDPSLNKNREVAEKLGFSIEKMSTYLEERQVTDMLSGVRDAADRAGKIINNILQFSRKPDSNFEPADINELVDQSIDIAALDYDLKANYDFRDILIKRDFADGLPKVSCVFNEIEQVILNIIQNSAHAFESVKHAPGNEPPELTISTRLGDNSVLIEVADNGPGMSQEVLRRVFDPFFTTKPVGIGTGLGLFVSYHIVTETHSGELSVESIPGKGTRFIISLPTDRLM